MANLLVEKRDIDFVLYEQLNIDELEKKERFSHCSREDFKMILDHALKFAENILAPINKEGDRTGAVWENGKVILPESARAALREFSKAGWVSMAENFEAGGQQLPFVVYTAAHEMFYAANAGLPLYPCLTHGAAKMIELYGTDDQKKRYMEKLYAFKWNGTMCLTETGAGTDLARIATKAVKIDERHYKISGHKIFITGGEHNGHENIVHPVLARIQGDPIGIKGISIFIVPKYRLNEDGSIGKPNDVICQGIEHKMGIKVSSTASLAFGDNGECIGELLGKPCQGITIMFNMMNEERFMMGVQGTGISSAAYLNALNYARTRFQGTDITKKGLSGDMIPIIKHPDIRRSLLWMKSYVEGLRALNYYTAYYTDLKNSETDESKKMFYGGIVDFLIPVCKAYSSDWAWDICEQAIQVFGGYGYCSDYPVEQFARDCKILSIYEGANGGVHATDLLGRKLFMNDGRIFRYFIDEIEKTINEASLNKSLKKYADIMKDAKLHLIKAVDYLKVLMKDGKVREAYLRATPFLEITGDTLLGWLHLWQLVIAEKKLEEVFKVKSTQKDNKEYIINNNKDAAFYSGKVHSAKFFITKVLQLQKAKIEGLLNDEAAALDIDDISFGEEMQK